MKPILMYSSATKKVYIVTRYKDLTGMGNYLAKKKIDVTDSFWEIVKKLPKKSQR